MSDDPIPGRVRYGRRSKTRRTICLALWLAVDEFAEIKTRARESGVSRSELVRRACFLRRLPKPIPALNRDAWIKLGPLGAEVYLCARVIRERDPAAPALELLERIHREIAALREDLLGRGAEDEPRER